MTQLRARLQFFLVLRSKYQQIKMAKQNQTQIRNRAAASDLRSSIFQLGHSHLMHLAATAFVDCQLELGAGDKKPTGNAAKLWVDPSWRAWYWYGLCGELPTRPAVCPARRARYSQHIFELL